MSSESDTPLPIVLRPSDSPTGKDWFKMLVLGGFVLLFFLLTNRILVSAYFGGTVTAMGKVKTNQIVPVLPETNISVGLQGGSIELKGEVSLYDSSRTIQYFNRNLWQQQVSNMETTDAVVAADLKESFEEFLTAFYSPQSTVVTYPDYSQVYFKWLILGSFPQGASVFSKDVKTYTLPLITPSHSAGTVDLVAGGTTSLTTGTFSSNTEYTTTGFTPSSNIKTSLDNSGGLGAWKAVGNKTADGTVLHQLNVSANVTVTASNLTLRNLFFSLSNTNVTITFVGTNIVIENCVFQVSRNEGDGCLFFNVNAPGAGVSVNNCVFRNFTSTTNRVELLGVTQLDGSGNLVISNNFYTLNYSVPTAADEGIGRMFFTIPSTIAGDILGDIYIVNNHTEDVGFSNGHAYTNNSPKGFFGWNVNAARNYTFKAYLDNNTFVNCPISRDSGIVAIGGPIPASWITSGGFFYVNDTDLGPNSIKKIMVYSRQTLPVLTYNTPLFFTPSM
jgi:hypothetical protein